MRTGARERAVAIVMALLAIGGWVAVASRPDLWPSTCPRSCASGQPATDALRVIQLNMLHGFPDFTHLREREEVILAEARKLQANVLLLQEVPWTRDTGALVEDLARRTGMNWAYRRANGNRRAILFEEGDAILSAFPMRDLASVELPWGTDFFEHRQALAATLDTPWGAVRVVSTHLSGEPAEVSANQVGALHAFAGDGSLPTLVGGDFNAHPDTRPMLALASSWRDVMLAAPTPDAGPTCCRDPSSAQGTPFTERVDYLWLAGPATIRAAWRIFLDPVSVGRCCSVAASDHAGLYGVLLPGKGASS